MSEGEIRNLITQIPGWELLEQDGINRLQKSFKFNDFRSALAFTNQVGAIAEEEEHHPSLYIQWGSVVITWWTHSIRGLHQNDFIMAARTNELYER